MYLNNNVCHHLWKVWLPVMISMIKTDIRRVKWRVCTYDNMSAVFGTDSKQSSAQQSDPK